MSVLMKILYAARYGRHDLLCAVAKLAQKIHKWTPACDKGLHRLMAYVKYSLQYRQLGWVGDPLENLSIHLYCDADFAGCTETKRSTSGVHTVIMGPFTCFPINGQSKRQGAVSHSTSEAEIVSADTAIFRAGIPALDLWQVLTGREHVSCTLHEDNETMIRVMQTGRNPTMRHLNRTRGVHISRMKGAARAPTHRCRVHPD